MSPSISTKSAPVPCKRPVENSILELKQSSAIVARRWGGFSHLTIKKVCCWLSAGRDGPERERLTVQKSSRELEELMTVTALMAEPVIAYDACGQMVFANLAAKTLFGEFEMQNSMDDCPETLGIFDGEGERLLQPEEVPLAQAVYQGKVVQVNLIVRQERA